MAPVGNMYYYRKYIGVDVVLRRIWSAAVWGEIDEEFCKSVSISEIRKTISKLPEPVPLQVSATLFGGISVIHKVQTHLLYEKSNVHQKKIRATMEGANNMSNRDIASGSGQFVEIGDDSEGTYVDGISIIEQTEPVIGSPVIGSPRDQESEDASREPNVPSKARVEKRSQRPPRPRKHPGPRKHPRPPRLPEDEPGDVLSDFQRLPNKGTSRNGIEDEEYQQSQLNDAAVLDKTADLDVTPLVDRDIASGSGQFVEIGDDSEGTYVDGISIIEQTEPVIGSPVIGSPRDQESEDASREPNVPSKAPFIPRRSARLSPVRRARAARGARNAVLLARGEKEELSTYQLIGRPPRSKSKRKRRGNINSRRTRRRSTSPAPASLAAVVPSGSQALQGSQVPMERLASSKSPVRSASSAPEGFESASPDPQGFRPATQETHEAFSSQAPPQVPVARPASTDLPSDLSGFQPATNQEAYDAFTSDNYMDTDDESQAYVAFHTPRGNNTMHSRPIESPYDLQTAEPAVDDLALQIFYTSLESQAGIPLEETLEMHEKEKAAYMMYRVVVMESLGKIEVEKNCLGVKEVRKGPKYKA